jgi:hypothetical protein
VGFTLLRPVRSSEHRFGGSHTQRDLLDLTLIEATPRRDGFALAAAMATERAAIRPGESARAALGRASRSVSDACAAGLRRLKETQSGNRPAASVRIEIRSGHCMSLFHPLKIIGEPPAARLRVALRKHFECFNSLHPKAAKVSA